MSKIIPIKDLRDTNKISDLAHKEKGPIFISKNGYDDLVLLSNESYEALLNKCNNHIYTSSFSKTNKFVQKEIKYKEYDGYGFIKVGCANFEIEISNVSANVDKIIDIITDSAKKGIKVLTFTELCLTGYTCSDLFFQNSLQNDVYVALKKLKEISKSVDMFFVIGAPIYFSNSIFNCAISFSHGHILGITPKTFLPNYNEFYEARQFEKAPQEYGELYFDGEYIPFYNKLIFSCLDYKDLKIGIEICEDLWVNDSPNLGLCKNGVTLMLNLSASNEIVGKKEYREKLISITSAKLICGYAYSSSGLGESTTDVVYSGAKYIYECGNQLVNCSLFGNGLIYTDIDIQKITNQRRKMTTYLSSFDSSYLYIPFSIDISNFSLTRAFKQNPFLVDDKTKAKQRYEFILRLQCEGLKKRINAAKADTLLVGLSGGLDSTLALLVAFETFKLMDRDLKKIYAITLPCFGTSQRTHDNALKLANELHVSFKEININKTVLSHFKDIGHDINNKNACYENAQARERTQVLLDYANDINGLMVGTGDLSELCLGWTTYNGDHMSNYSVNASISKTLVKEIVKMYADEHSDVRKTLYDIINTPISPELLPAKDGEIAQKTEDNIGPYEIHDFIIYYYLRHNFSFKKIFYLLQETYKNKYSKEQLRTWLKLFIKRFYNSQFKRSCLPDGVKVGTVCISPRGDLRMPSDADCSSFLIDIDNF